LWRTLRRLSSLVTASGFLNPEKLSVAAQGFRAFDVRDSGVLNAKRPVSRRAESFSGKFRVVVAFHADSDVHVMMGTP
jgi:hypothetical protein